MTTQALEVADLPASQFGAAAALLARGMRDNPLHVAAYGPDPARREAVHLRLMTAFFRTAAHNEPIGLWRDGTLVACTGALTQGGCRPSPAQAVRMVPTLVRLGPRTTARISAWLTSWRRHDPDEPHVHLGPLAVDRGLQGQGIGSVLLAEHARRLDAAGALGYLETDKPENVRFYERQGYRVGAEERVLGVPCWFMRREPRAAISPP